MTSRASVVELRGVKRTTVRTFDEAAFTFKSITISTCRGDTLKNMIPKSVGQCQGGTRTSHKRYDLTSVPR